MTDFPSPTGVESARDTEMYRLRDIIASHISCEDDCQKMPTGCGCALTASRAILYAAQAAPAPPFIDELKDVWDEIVKRSVDPDFEGSHAGLILAAAMIERRRQRRIPAQPTQGGDKGEAKPFLWICLVPNAWDSAKENIRAWTPDPDRAAQLKADGLNMRPLYATPQPSNAYSSQQPGHPLERLWKAIEANTTDESFWMAEILLHEITKETGYSPAMTSTQERTP